MSILYNTGPTTLTKTWYVDGTATDVGTVTIGIDDTDGNTIVASGTAVTDNSDGTYTYPVPVQTQVKHLDVTWTSGSQSLTDRVEIVGGWLFTENELRTFQNSDLASTSMYPDSAIGEVRDAITKEFETICGVAFVPTFHRQTLEGSGSYELWLDKPKITSVIKCVIGSTTVTGFDYDDLLPVIYRTAGVFNTPTTSDPRNITVSYRHGYETVPPDIKQAALTLARSRLISNQQGTGVPAHASSWTDASGTYQAFAPSAKTERWYGMPTVDIPLARHRLNIPVY